MEFVSVKINVQSRFFAGFQYCSGLLQIEHALFTEDVDVVHVEVPCLHQVYDGRELFIYNISCRLFSG